jgi:coatomer subunit beta'
LGREEPAVSMDQNGKVIWARHNEIQTVNVKTAAGMEILMIAGHNIIFK